MKLHVLFEHGRDLRPHGCSHIRLLLPLAHPSVAGQLQWTAGTSYEGGADVVVVERMWRPDTITVAEAEALIARVRREGARLIYTLDDNLLDLRPWSALYRPLTAEQQAVVRLFARAADGIIVSTEPLRERMLRLNPRVTVVPNAVDERLFRLADPPPAPGGSGDPITIGFMGTFSHEGDLMMVLEPLRAVLRGQPGGCVCSLSAVSAIRSIARFEGLAVEVLNQDRPVDYPEFVDVDGSTLRWDLAVAPLENTPFTLGKSDLKFLDYSALGIPASTVESRHTASVRHVETGWLADNSIDAWREALEGLLADSELRRRLAARAREYVAAERTLARSAVGWPQALRELTTG